VFGLLVAPFVMLCDPNQNEIEVAVKKKNGKVYFTDGWSFLNFFYGILVGHFNPPQRMLLQNHSANEYRNSFIRYGSNALFLPTSFCHTIVKELTVADVTSILVSRILVF